MACDLEEREGKRRKMIIDGLKGAGGQHARPDERTPKFEFPTVALTRRLLLLLQLDETVSHGLSPSVNTLVPVGGGAHSSV